ncbi:MAG TPA: FeoB small GTPase domain-containing protein, partial [Candidatus Bathyarchaeia archaeon]|nr:FeoB small GTPase domain-containing protein [Candidatus Bathyarchaeia archaeon]
MARKKIRVALAGNPNCGKTTVFNNLTHQWGDVGNYPGVTVEIKTGSVVFGDYEIEVTDLPGTYSLSAYSQDELVARNMIVHDQPDVIVNIIDAATLERNLYLTLQLLELEVPMIVALNMVDVAEQKGFVIDDQALAACLGSPVVRTVGHQDEGTGGLLFCIVDLYEGRRQNQKIHVDYGPEIFDELQHLERVLLSQPCPRCRCPVRWLALKILEQDPWVLEEVSTLKTAEAILQQKEKSRQHLKAHFGEAPEMVIADRRYGFVSAALKKVRSAAADRYDISDTVDKVVLNRVLGFPIFALVMFAIFKFTFGGSQPFVAALGSCFEWLARQADVLLPAGLVRSFV